MTIIPAGAIRPVADRTASDRRPVVADSGFRVAAASADAGTQVPRSASGAASLSAAGAMLALQEQAGLDGSMATDLAEREARKHAHDILEALGALQKALLGGGSPGHSLSRLVALAETLPAVHDPALARILSSIRLRAQLEVLRHAPRLAGQRPLPVPEGPSLRVEYGEPL